MSNARISLGRAAENLAARRLTEKGFKVVARNVRVRYAEVGIAGELDLVAMDGSTLVFVEVKAGRPRGGTGNEEPGAEGRPGGGRQPVAEWRESARRGPERPAFAVGPAKQVRLRRLARAWLTRTPSYGRFDEIRFDVIGVVMDATGRIHDYEHIRSAF